MKKDESLACHTEWYPVGGSVIVGISTRVLYPRPTATLLRSMALYGEDSAAPTFLVYGSSDLHRSEVTGKSGMMTQLHAHTHLEDVDEVYSPRPNL